MPRYDVLPVTMLTETTDGGWGDFPYAIGVTTYRATPPPKSPYSVPLNDAAATGHTAVRSRVSWSTVNPVWGLEAEDTSY